MKIVHVTSNYPPNKGGVEQVVARLATMQSQSGHDVTVITTRYGAHKRLTVVEGSGVKAVRLPCISLSGYLIAPHMLFVIANSSADIVHFHGLASAGSLMGSMLHSGPKVCTAYFHPADTYSHSKLMRLAIALAARQSGLYQTIIALTKRELVLLQELTKHRRILVIPSGIDSTVFMRGHVFYKRDRDMILFVGRLAGNKGLSSLIQAIGIVAAKIPTVRLVVVGKDCGELVSAKRLAIKLGNRVEFLGEVPDDMLDKLIRTACLMVLPSKYESFGLVVLESLARGTPVLVSNGVALADEVTDAGCGLTFPYGDIAEMAECIGRIMSCDEEWHRLSQQGLRFVKGYSWDNIVAKMLDVYAEAMG